MEWLLYQRTVSRRAAEAEKAHKAVADQFRGPKIKSPASVVKSLSGACVIFEKAGNSPLEEAGGVSDNFLISMSGPNKPGSLPTALQDIVRKDKDIAIKEDWNRQNITAFMCGPNSTLTVIYRGSGGAFDKDTVSGVLAALKDSCRIYICLTKNDERTKSLLQQANKARPSPQVKQ
jgi:hypothetical protein